MKKIGVFGGTFNPIHNGHIYLAKSAYKLLNLDKVLVIPSGFSYQKSGENVLSKYIRADMVKLAIKDYPYLEYSDIEVKKEGNSYTYSTILDLKEEYLDALLYLIIGADTLFNIESWKNIETLLSNCILSVMQRDDHNKSEVIKMCNYLNVKYNSKAEIIDIEKIDISSTNIRNSIKNGNFTNDCNELPQNVYKYIIDNALYKG